MMSLDLKIILSYSRRDPGTPQITCFLSLQKRKFSMDGSGEHYAKWNKPGSERQIPYDLTYKWNIINNNNEQIKI